MKNKAARMTDKTAGGTLSAILPPWNVYIEDRLAVRILDCCCHLRPVVPPAASNVHINGRPAARVTDRVLCSCTKIVAGASRTYIDTCVLSSDEELARMQREGMAEEGLSPGRDGTGDADHPSPVD